MLGKDFDFIVEQVYEEDGCMSVTRFFICFQVPFQPQAMRHMQHNKRSACIKEMLEILTVFISFVIQTKRDNTNQISCAAYTLLSPPHTYVC